MFDTGELEDLGRKLADQDPTLADDESLQQWVLALEAFRRRLDSAAGRSLAELESRGTCDRDAGCSTAAWLARKAGFPPGVVLQDGSTRALRYAEDLRPVVVDSLGSVLDLGRRIPFPPPGQRRAMEARDGGCVSPGCDWPPAWCDAHHVDERSRGGRTDVRRMGRLCRHHHRITHRSGWAMYVTDDQWFWWESASGRQFWSQRHGRRRDGQPPGGPCGCG